MRIKSTIQQIGITLDASEDRLLHLSLDYRGAIARMGSLETGAAPTKRLFIGQQDGIFQNVVSGIDVSWFSYAGSYVLGNADAITHKLTVVFSWGDASLEFHFEYGEMKTPPDDLMEWLRDVERLTDPWHESQLAGIHCS